MTVDGAALATEARKFLGDPYVYGATGPNSFDCSGLMQYVYKAKGISLPRTSEEQATVGKAVALGSLLPGDLVFAAGSDGTTSHPGHVGMYVGGSDILEAPHTGADVRITPISEFSAVSARRVAGVVDNPAADWEEQNFQDNASPSSLFSFPTDIVTFFTKGTSDLADVGAFLTAFTRPSTYVRAGSGLFGFIFLIAGLFFLVREANHG